MQEIGEIGDIQRKKPKFARLFSFLPTLIELMVIAYLFFYFFKSLKFY